MKVIIINGSPRRKGATAKLLTEYQNVLKGRGVDTELVHISGLDFRPCRGCGVCYRKGQCIFKDDASELSRKIEAADALIIGSPTYASQISGELKLFIDRGHFVIEQLLKGKYGITVTTGENYGNRAVSAYLDQLIRYSGGQLCGKLRMKLPFGSDPLLDDKIRRKIDTQVNRLITAQQTQKRYLWQSIQHQFIFRIGIRRFVLKKGTEYQGVRERWRINGTEKIPKEIKEGYDY